MTNLLLCGCEPHGHKCLISEGGCGRCFEHCVCTPSGVASTGAGRAEDTRQPWHASTPAASLSRAARLLALLLGHEARITDEQWSEVRAMALDIQCSKCKGLGRVSDVLHGVNVHNCPNCNGRGSIIQPDIVLREPPITDEQAIQATHHCPNCEAAARDLDDLHALCDRQSAILSRVAVALRGPEPPLTKWGHADLPERVTAVMRERDDLRARIEAECDAISRKAMDEDDDYYIIAQRFRALLAEKEAK